MMLISGDKLMHSLYTDKNIKTFQIFVLNFQFFLQFCFLLIFEQSLFLVSEFISYNHLLNSLRFLIDF